MNIEDINEKLGDVTQELSKQFQTEFMRLAQTEEGLLGLMHEIAENPEMYYSMLGSKIVRLATAYNEAVNSYMSLDEILHEQWEQPEPAPEVYELEEVLPSLSPDVITFPVDPFDLPEGEQGTWRSLCGSECGDIQRIYQEVTGEIPTASDIANAKLVIPASPSFIDTSDD